MSADAPVHLGVDLGTSSLKVIAVADDGKVHGVARRGYPTAHPEPGAAEQDPCDWWVALRGALDDLAATVPTRSWSSIGLSAMLPTLVELDAGGRPLGPAITWEDARAEPEAEELGSAIGDDSWYRTTGQRVDGRYLAPMHARLQRLGRSGAMVAGAKDVLFAELTGTLLTDPSTAAGFALYDLDSGRWDAELVARSGIPALPAIAPATTALRLRPQWRKRWDLPELPVVLGGADSVLGALGLGAAAHGDVAVIAGTSAIVIGVCDHPIRDEQRRYLVTPLATPGWGLEMDLLAMGSAFSGIAELVGLPGPAELLQAARTVPVADAPVFLPYLAPGEQGALWDPQLTGTVHGLRLGMSAGHIGRALVTGIVVELRRCIETLADSTGTRGPIQLGGNAAASPLLWQDLADATGCDVVVDPLVRDHSALGAALLAAQSCGSQITLGGARRIVTARPGEYAAWQDVAGAHDELRHRIGKDIRS